MRRHRHSLTRRLLAHPGLSGLVAIALILVAVVVSYSAENGIPFVPTYNLTVDIPNATQLTKNSDVRIGGFRVGQVLAVQAMPPTRGRPPFARLRLALSTSVHPLPVDTVVEMRLGSLLGGKYIQLLPGRARQTISSGGHLDLAHARSLVELDEAFRLFDGPTTRAIQNAIGGLGDGLAGRGTALNDATGSVSQLLPPLDDVLTAIDDPNTRLAGFVRATAQATSALAPVAPQLADVFGQAQRTLSALTAAGPALPATIEALPGTELTGTTTLHHLTPVLAQAATLARALRPAAPLLRPTGEALDGLVVGAIPAARKVPPAVPPLEATMRAGNAFATDPVTLGALRVLGANDLGSFSSSLFLGLGAVLRTTAPAQLGCNAVSIWIRNLASAFSEGDGAGAWFRMIPVFNPGQSLQTSQPSPDLHLNPYPNENASECEAGNEPYTSGQAIGNPPGLQSRHTQATAGSGGGR